jgi:pimeloyl-ACP methyl ester carboxylesterase
MIAVATTWIARVIAVAAAMVLAIAAVLYHDSGESWAPYAAMVPCWFGAYFACEGWLARRDRTRRGRGGQVIPASTRLGVAVAGAGLALLSAGMAVRYAMTPETLRQLDRVAKRERINSGGNLLSYYTTDSPGLPRILLIHGTPGHAGVFADYLLDPIQGFEVVAVDRLGFGRSAGSGPVVSFELQARAISALLVQRQGHWPIVVGHSLGGPIAARIAADFPDRVRGLVILAGSLDPDLETPSWYNDVTMLPGIDLKMPTLYDTSNAEIAGAREQTRVLSGVLGRICCPVQVIHGTADTLVPVANVDFFQKAVVNSPSIEITLIEGEGHAVHKLRAREVRAAIAALSSSQ